MAESQIATTVNDSSLEDVSSLDDFVQKGSLKELYKQQAKIAMYLEVGYICASSFPELSHEIRLSAHDAMTLHKTTVGLMKKNYGATAHIIGTMIPLIIKAVELEDGDLIERAYSKIIGIASNMKSEAENAKGRYQELHLKIVITMGTTEKTQAEEKERVNKIKEELEKQKRSRDELKNEQEQKQAEKKRREEKIQRYRTKVDKKTESKDVAEKAERESSADMFANVLSVPVAIAGGQLAPALKQITAAVLSRAQRNEKRSQVELETDQLNELKEKKRKEKARLREVEEELKRKEREEFETHRLIKELSLEHEESPGNIKSLQQALEVLGDVYGQLSKIADFWDDIVVVVTYLSDQAEAGELLIKKIKNKTYASLFLDDIREAKKGWEIFKGICADYVAVCDRSPEFAVEIVYGFMSRPVDHKSQEEKKQRKEKLFEKIESLIPQFMIENSIPQITLE